MFAGDPAPFVMELPAYHLPTVGNLLRSMWERGWSFIKKAGTIILLSTIFVWFTSRFGWGQNCHGTRFRDSISRYYRPKYTAIRKANRESYNLSNEFFTSNHRWSS